MVQVVVQEVEWLALLKHGSLWMHWMISCSKESVTTWKLCLGLRSMNMHPHESMLCMIAMHSQTCCYIHTKIRSLRSLPCKGTSCMPYVTWHIHTSPEVTTETCIGRKVGTGMANMGMPVAGIGMSPLLRSHPNLTNWTCWHLDSHIKKIIHLDHHVNFSDEHMWFIKTHTEHIDQQQVIYMLDRLPGILPFS